MENRNIEEGNEKKSTASRIGAAVARIGLEATLGGIGGWYIASNFVHPTAANSGGDVGMFMSNYAEQMSYNAEGAILGAVMLPIASRIIQSAYMSRKNN